MTITQCMTLAGVASGSLHAIIVYPTPFLVCCLRVGLPQCLSWNIIKACGMPGPVPAQLLGYPSLRELHLPRLQQKVLPEWFGDLAQLTKLTLTSHSFCCFPDPLLRLFQLEAARPILPHFPKQIVQMATWPRLHELHLAIVGEKGVMYDTSVDQQTAFNDSVEALQAALLNRYSSMCVSRLARDHVSFHLSSEAKRIQLHCCHIHPLQICHCNSK